MKMMPVINCGVSTGVNHLGPPSGDTAAQQSALNQIFEVSDTDKDGILSAKEVEAAVASGEGGAADADALYGKLSADGTRTVDRQRFMSSFPGGSLTGPTLYLLAQTKDMTDHGYVETRHLVSLVNPETGEEDGGEYPWIPPEKTDPGGPVARAALDMMYGAFGQAVNDAGKDMLGRMRDNQAFLP
ncbi:EF-hand domain-containing protein [Nitrospirillum pindoramense]|uniref:EF-hand domain-containing protein n=1 Tax=Nitrospirillum amazonense TaxID=28077 RepID=A0A560H3K2_9PROT|nr:hypothetical protein [Nitrospirillum amazonense]TWB40409.1 hypothetical protein FBZ90_10912 [Nitrospirillum amazonense]